MDILILDQGSVGGGLALKAARLGHNVHWYIVDQPNNYPKLTGKGLHKNIKKVTEWMTVASKMDLILCTENGSLLPQLERFRRQGVAVYAPTQAVADLEIKRGLGLKFFEKHGLPVPEYETFKSIKEAEKYVLKNPEAYAFKTMGDNEDKSLSYVSKTPEQMVQQLRTWQKQGLNPKGDVMLQKKVDGMCEMSVSSFIGKDGFNGPFIHCFEHKKLMNEEKGPNTGEQGSLMKTAVESKLADLVLKPLEKSLVEMGAFCNFDMNCMIDKDGKPWVLEATSRFGWPATNIELEMFNDDPFEQLVDACLGHDTISLSPKWTIGVVLSIPPFPKDAQDLQDCVGIPLYGVTKDNENHIHPQSVMVQDVLGADMKETPHWVSCGNYIAVVTEKGNTIREARERVYGIVDELDISNIQYRTDIGVKVAKVESKLVKLGYINNITDTD